MATVNSRRLKKTRVYHLLRASATQEEMALAVRMQDAVAQLVRRMVPTLHHIAVPLQYFPETECRPGMHPFNPKARGFLLLPFRVAFSPLYLFITENGTFCVGERCERVSTPRHFHPFLGAVNVGGQPVESRFTWEFVPFGEIVTALRHCYDLALERRQKIMEALKQDAQDLRAIEQFLEGEPVRPWLPLPDLTLFDLNRL